MSDNLHFFCRHCRTWYGQFAQMVACAKRHGRVAVVVRRDPYLGEAPWGMLAAQGGHYGPSDGSEHG